MSRDQTTALHRQLVKALPERKGRDGKAVDWIFLHTLPKTWNPDKGLAIVVNDDASITNDTAHDRKMVRVSVHSHDYAAARKMARNIHSYFTSPLGGLGLGISRRRSTGVIVGPDSLAGGYVATASFSCGTSKAFM